jgi:hypothetical protein
MGRTVIEALGDDVYQKLRVQNPTLRAMLRASVNEPRGRQSPDSDPQV